MCYKSQVRGHVEHVTSATLTGLASVLASDALTREKIPHEIRFSQRGGKPEKPRR